MALFSMNSVGAWSVMKTMVGRAPDAHVVTDGQTGNMPC